MAKTATEYKEDLLRQLSGDATIAEREANFLTLNLPYADTPASLAATQSLIDTASELAVFLRTVALALEDIDAT